MKTKYAHTHIIGYLDESVFPHKITTVTVETAEEAQAQLRTLEEDGYKATCTCMSIKYEYYPELVGEEE